MGMSNKTKYIQVLTIVVSLLLHFCLGLGLSHMKPAKLPSAPVPIELKYAQPEKETQQLVVEVPETQKKYKDLKNKVDRLSKFTTRVKKESLARRSALKTQNLQKKSGHRRNNKSKALKRQTASKDLFNLKNPNLRSRNSINEGQGGSAPMFIPSTTSNYIPNVNRADANALNADQFKFFSYYSRLKNKLYPRWTNQIRSLIRKSSPTHLYKLGQQTRYTQLKVLMTKKGYIKSIQLEKSSGVEALDLIAAKAFKDSSPILNPPVDMVRRDGMIHITYGFNLDFNPRQLVRRRSLNR